MAARRRWVRGVARIASVPRRRLATAGCLESVCTRSAAARQGVQLCRLAVAHAVLGRCQATRHRVAPRAARALDRGRRGGRRPIRTRAAGRADRGASRARSSPPVPVGTRALRLCAMSAARAAQETPRQPLLWVCAAIAAALLLHALQVPAWITAAALALVAWRVASLLGTAPLPGGIVRVALGLVLVAAVFAQFHTLNGLVPGTAMLMLMAAIKLLETGSRRDQ